MLFFVAIRNILRNKRRSLAIVCTVAMGATALFTFHGFNIGIMNQYRDNSIHARYGHGQIHTRGYLDTVYEKPWEHWIPDYESVATELAALPGVDKIFPRVSFFALLSNGQVSVSGQGQGIEGASEASFFYTLNVTRGLPLTDQKDGIMLGEGLASALNVKPGDIVTVLTNTVHGSLNGADLVVTGVFHTGSKEFDDRIFRIQLSQAKSLLDTDKIENVAIGLKNLQDWDSVARTFHAGSLEAVPFAKLDEVYYQHSVDWLDAQFQVIEVIIVAIVLLGIVNTASQMILERKREIGNLRVNGESVFDVMRLIALEGLALGLLGALLGLGFACLVNVTLLRQGIVMPAAPGITRQFAVFVELQPFMAVKTAGVCILVTVVSTLVAAKALLAMPPAGLLRSV